MIQCGTKTSIRNGAQLQVAFGFFMFSGYLLRRVTDEITRKEVASNSLWEAVFVMYIWFFIVLGFTILLWDESYAVMKYATLLFATMLFGGLTLWSIFEDLMGLFNSLTQNPSMTTISQSGLVQCIAWMFTSLVGLYYLLQMIIYTFKLRLSVPRNLLDAPEDGRFTPPGLRLGHEDGSLDHNPNIMPPNTPMMDNRNHLDMLNNSTPPPPPPTSLSVTPIRLNNTKAIPPEPQSQPQTPQPIAAPAPSPPPCQIEQVQNETKNSSTESETITCQT